MTLFRLDIRTTATVPLVSGDRTIAVSAIGSRLIAIRK
jgi:hypothetical protein